MSADTSDSEKYGTVQCHFDPIKELNFYCDCMELNPDMHHKMKFFQDHNCNKAASYLGVWTGNPYIAADASFVVDNFNRSESSIITRLSSASSYAGRVLALDSTKDSLFSYETEPVDRTDLEGDLVAGNEEPSMQSKTWDSEREWADNNPSGNHTNDYENSSRL